MQVLDRAIHAGPDNVLVEFLGEGGEKVAVTMALSEPQLVPDEAALVSRARQMMVQCAVFGVGAQYGRRSDHLPDRQGGSAEATTATGPYTFEYYDEGSVRKLEAVDLPSLAAAHDEALRSAIDLLDDAASPLAPKDWAVRVRDGSGNIVLSVDFEEARRAKSAEV